MSSTCSPSGSARRRPGKAIRRSTSPDMSTTSTASGNRPTTPSRGPISGHSRSAKLTPSPPYPAIPTILARSTSAFTEADTPICPQPPQPAQPSQGSRTSPATGDLNAGKPVALTLSFSEAVTVAGGTPTLTLNDGGTATYASGSGTSALTFDYTVGSTRQLDLEPCRHRAQPADRGHDRGQLRQRRQPVTLRPDPERAADRHHHAPRHRDQQFASDRRSQRGQDRSGDAQLQ